MPVFKLDKNKISFPDPALAEPDGLLAIEGDLSVDRLLLAYSHGVFPWYDEGQPIMWWCPRERFIIRPGEIHISHSMRKYMKKHAVEVVMNRDFSDKGIFHMHLVCSYLLWIILKKALLSYWNL